MLFNITPHQIQGMTEHALTEVLNTNVAARTLYPTVTVLAP